MTSDTQLKFPLKSDETIEREIDSLEESFTSLIVSIEKKLDESRDGVRAVLRTLSALPQKLNSVFSSLLEKSSPFECASHYHIIFKLNKVWNFIDFKLLEHVIKMHGDKELKLAMDEYSTRLREFLSSTTIDQLIVNWGNKSKNLQPTTVDQHPEIKLIVSMGKDPKKCTLDELDCLQRRIGSCTLPLSETAMILYAIYLSSVTVVWLVAEEDASSFSIALSKLIDNDFIEQFGIEFVSLEDRILYPTNEVVPLYLVQVLSI